MMTGWLSCVLVLSPFALLLFGPLCGVCLTILLVLQSLRCSGEERMARLCCLSFLHKLCPLRGPAGRCSHFPAPPSTQGAGVLVETFSDHATLVVFLTFGSELISFAKPFQAVKPALWSAVFVKGRHALSAIAGRAAQPAQALSNSCGALVLLSTHTSS